MVINMLWSLVLKERSRTYEDKTDRILWSISVNEMIVNVCDRTVAGGTMFLVNIWVRIKKFVSSMVISLQQSPLFHIWETCWDRSWSLSDKDFLWNLMYTVSQSKRGQNSNLYKSNVTQQKHI